MSNLDNAVDYDSNATTWTKPIFSFSTFPFDALAMIPRNSTGMADGLVDELVSVWNIEHAC